jgi:hypothetical protein
MVPSGTVIRLAILIHLNKSKTASVNNLIQCPLEGFGPFLPFSPCLCGGEHIFACKGAPVSTSGLWGGNYSTHFWLWFSYCISFNCHTYRCGTVHDHQLSSFESRRTCWVPFATCTHLFCTWGHNERTGNVLVESSKRNAKTLSRLEWDQFNLLGSPTVPQLCQ